MTRWSFARGRERAALTLATALVAGCGSLLPQPAAPLSFYTLDADSPARAALAPGLPSGPTLLVTVPQAAAGLDSTRILYTRGPHQLAYFANSQWVDTPARMLGPMMVSAVADSGAFRAVVMTPGAAAGELRLDTELLRLQQQFGAARSRVLISLRATLSDSATRRVIARQDFEVEVQAPHEDAYGGVLAANQAARQLLKALAMFSADAARQWRPDAAP
jgi:cholesterol transport system auxiliary component